MPKTLPFLFFMLVMPSSLLKANEEGLALTEAKATSGSSYQKDSFFAPEEPSIEPQNTFVIPALSLLLPGLGQLIEGQYAAAATYFSIAVAGNSYGSYNLKKSLSFTDSAQYEAKSDEFKENLVTHGEFERKAAAGYQLAFATGSFSAYHNFRTRALTHQPYGGYRFLSKEKEDTPLDILMAPLRFDFLARSSTYIPLSIITGYFLLSQTISPPEEMVRDKLSGSDILFSATSSLAAGTHEEALFRGWMLPLLYETTNSPLWSNGLTSLFFAAAHLSTVQIPLAQLLIGWHLGSVTQKNGWSIQEAVFIHTWWDIVAFLSIYQYKLREPDARVLPVLWLPPLEVHF